MSHLESTVKAIEVQLAHRVTESIVDEVMDEDDASYCSDLIDCPTLVFGIYWSQVFSAGVGDNFLGCGVVLGTSVAI